MIVDWTKLYFGMVIDRCHSEGKELFLTRVGFLERVAISNCSFIVRRAFWQLNVTEAILDCKDLRDVFWRRNKG